MMRFHTSGTIMCALALTGACAGGPHGPAREPATARSSCLAFDAEVDARLRATRRLVTSSDPDDVRARAFRRLPAVADSNVQPVSSDAICAAARDAYDAALLVTARRPGRRVYVIRVGDRYVVEDPTFRIGEFGLVMVLDDRFAVLSRSAH